MAILLDYCLIINCISPGMAENGGIMKIRWAIFDIGYFPSAQLLTFPENEVANITQSFPTFQWKYKFPSSLCLPTPHAKFMWYPALWQAHDLKWMFTCSFFCKYFHTKNSTWNFSNPTFSHVLGVNLKTLEVFQFVYGLSKLRRAACVFILSPGRKSMSW